MRTNTPAILDKRVRLMDHLRAQGFTVARTATGFIAVDEDGIIFNVSPVRTHVCVVHPVTEQYMEERTAGQPDPKWFDAMIEEFVTWSKER